MSLSLNFFKNYFLIIPNPSFGGRWIPSGADGMFGLGIGMFGILGKTLGIAGSTILPMFGVSMDSISCIVGSELGSNFGNPGKVVA